MNRKALEQKLRQQVSAARLRPETGERSTRIYSATKSIVDFGSVFFVLSDTPEQTSDIFRVLVDDKSVVAFELDRSDGSKAPTAVIVYSVDDFRRAIGPRLAEKELQVAIELAREALNQ
ncbi:hypothetical protein [Aquidulcibacter sp.]|jgi:hypothetical protein|uniref:hypothetical protein n=1 Tax=Aquidulcibacter sp. TaxID=2052990 RepID=UPI003BA7EDB8